MPGISGADWGTVWYASPEMPGVRAAVTVRLDGSVLGFELHAEGTERAYPDLVAGVEFWRAFDDGEMPPIPAVSIGARQIRAVPVGELASRARAALREHLERIREHGTSVRPPRTTGDEMERRIVALRGDLKRPGRRGQPDEYYARLAVAYEAWQDTGDRLAALATQVHLTVSGLRAALNVARNRGFLTDAPKGRAGGTATEAATRLLEENED